MKRSHVSAAHRHVLLLVKITAGTFYSLQFQITANLWRWRHHDSYNMDDEYKTHNNTSLKAYLWLIWGWPMSARKQANVIALSSWQAVLLLLGTHYSQPSNVWTTILCPHTYEKWAILQLLSGNHMGIEQGWLVYSWRQAYMTHTVKQKQESCNFLYTSKKKKSDYDRRLMHMDHQKHGSIENMRFYC